MMPVKVWVATAIYRTAEPNLTAQRSTNLYRRCSIYASDRYSVRLP
jgi:hypothetical protein